MKALALTDHGAMYGIKEFLNYANKKNGPVNAEIKKLKKEIESLKKSGEAEEKIAPLREQLMSTKAKRFKPIVGCECYLARRDRFKQTDKVDGSGWHLVVLAKNLTGYKNLVKLVSKSWTEGFYYRPRIDKELLEQYSEGLIVSSACLGGEISRKIDDGKIEEAEEAVQWYKSVFGEDYYIELQRHKTDRPDANKPRIPSRKE